MKIFVACAGVRYGFERFKSFEVSPLLLNILSPVRAGVVSCVCRSKCVRVTEWLVYVMLCVCTCVRACLRACVRVFKITYFVFNTNLWNIL